jgi:hypothetical protein
MDPFRVGPPYDAMHLDWYLNIFKPVPENAIYINGRCQVGSWGKSWLRDYWFWFQESPTMAFERLMGEATNQHNDLCNISFLRSWALQYGHGCEADREQSEWHLATAIPHPHEHYWPFVDNWLKFIYDDDFSSLGWDA